MQAMGEKVRSTGSEHRFYQRIRVIIRIFVVFNWLAVLSALFLHWVPRSAAFVAITVFRDTAICATLWLTFETAVALKGRAATKNLLIDAMLILPMLGFWFIVAAATF
jgi:hypothetical protein